MERKPIIFANWKMNLRQEDASRIAGSVASYVTEEKPDLDVGICPPSLYLETVLRETSDTPVQTGAQNCHHEKDGAYTGEISPYMVTDLGCEWVILGHSERRHEFGETPEFINQKVNAAEEAGLNVIYCVGEKESQREADRTQEVIYEQLATGLQGAGFQRPDQELVIGYEPVWAIGTGRSAGPAQAQEVHRWIRTWFREQFDDRTADELRIQYGGSVKPHNVQELMGEPDVDGALVGSASLTADSFLDLLKNSLA